MDEQTLHAVQESILRAEEKLNELEDDISKAKKAGISIEKMERSARDLRAKIQRMKSVYVQ